VIDKKHMQILKRAACTAAALLFFCTAACSIFASRPVQEMSDTGAAIKAAKEVQADTLAPEHYRLANEYWFKAKNEYRFKNFKEARDYAQKARKAAEQAEFDAIRAGANRSDISETPPPPPPQPTPYDYPAPTGTPFEAAEKKNSPPPPAQEPAPAPAPSVP